MPCLPLYLPQESPKIGFPTKYTDADNYIADLKTQKLTFRGKRVIGGAGVA